MTNDFSARGGVRCRMRAALLLAAAFSAPAMAQSEDITRDGLDDIVVTAQRRDQKLQDVAASVTAVSSQTLVNLQINNAQDLGRVVPNVKFDPVTGGTTGLKPYIRGGGVTDGGMVLSESEVGIYLDGVYRARLSTAMVDFLELDRIEVVRGPQGVLYGRNSSAGAVNFITKAPTDTTQGIVEVGYGSWNERRLKAWFSTPLDSEGKWRASVNGLARGRDGGRQYNVTLDKKVGEENFYGIQGDLAYVGETIDGRLTFFWNKTDGDGQWAVPNDVSGDGLTITPTTGSFRRVASPVESFTRVEQYGATLRLSAPLPGGTLTSISAWSKLRDDWRQDFSGGVNGALIGMPGVTLALFDRTSETAQHQFSQEVQATGSILDGLDYVAGIYYFTERADQDLLTTIFFAPSSTQFVANTDSFAGFGQVIWRVVEGLSLTAGGRLTVDDKRLKGFIGATGFDLRDSWSKFTPKLGVDWRVAPSVLLFASYSQGFKSGGYNGLAGSAGQISEPFLPQFTTAWEAGLKSDLFDNMLRFNMSLFYNKIRNRQQSITVTSGPDIGSFVVENYDATLKGVEAEMTWRAAKGLTVWANGSINDGRYTGCSVAAQVNCSVIDNVLPVFPDWTVAAGFDYSIDAGPGTLRLGGDFNARDGYFSTADNVLIGWVPQQEFLNAYVGYDIGRLSLQVTGKNLFDKTGWSTGFGFSVVQPRFAIDPRTFLVSARYRF